ncbi:C-type mannose receptor 2-like isoform X1 [Chaetodon trifascialis]|uniref:C-type mannose receptor 2-like isoform X1 n=1 Tax=Chaetodon trifascialis TaxID=109706 RepID=UPI00399139E2
MMKATHTFFLLFISGFSSFVLGSSEFHLITLSKTYNEAKNYCREMYTDLATVHNSTDMNMIILLSNTTVRAWIGLETGSVWKWHWSPPGEKLDFSNWKAGEPQNEDQNACGAMDQYGKWFESDCATKRSFVCRGHSDTSGYMFVAAAKSWKKAQSHCRSSSSELVSIHSAEENEAVRNVFVSQNAWIGLFKDHWKWSDGSNSSFRHWKPNQPNNLEDQECVLAVFIDQGKWNDVKCSLKRHFFCHGARKSIPATTSQSATTASEVTTTNSPGLVSSTASTAPNNATPVMSTDMTATQLPPTTTVQLTTDSVSALTTPTGTSAQSTTWALTLKPTENSPSLLPGMFKMINGLCGAYICFRNFISLFVSLLSS